MRQRYDIEDGYGFVLGSATNKEMLDGVKYGLLEEVYLGETYIYNQGLLEHFNRRLKEKRREAKQANIIHCWECGKVVPAKETHKRQYCTSCFETKSTEEAEIMEQYTKLQKQIQFERAIKILERQERKIDIREYREAIELVRAYTIKYPTKFRSKEEMATAIELVQNKVYAIVGKEVAGHKFDFMLPEYKVLLEVDGYLHDYKQREDAKFDINGLRELGNDWEVIRVPVKYIEKNISKLIDYIEEAYEYKQRLRNENSGIIPEYFSNREQLLYEGLK